MGHPYKMPSEAGNGLQTALPRLYAGDGAGGIAVGIDRTGKPPRRVDGVGGQVGEFGNVPFDKSTVRVGTV